MLLVLLSSLSSFSQRDSLSDLIFSNPGGIYKESFNLNISTETEEIDIFYTIDGSKPNKSSSKYDSSIYIDTTAVIRAVGYKKGRQFTELKTISYILEKRKLTLPIVSISVRPSSMFDPVYGLYMKGVNASQEAPYRGANFHKDKELEINIEYFDTSGLCGFNQIAGLKIFGGYSRGMPQKSFSIISRKSYGKKNFDYPLFPDLKFKKYKSFILRNGGSDNNRTHFRDVFMTQLVKDLNFDIQSYNTCIVFINGSYWGIYHMREKLNEHFIKQHYKLEKDSVSMMKHRNDLRIGKRLNYNEILSYIGKTDFSFNKNIDSLNKLIDIDNFLDYNISETYFANTDAGGNIRYWRSWKDSSRWRWLMFDTDFGFGLDGATAYKRNTIKDFTKKSNEAWPYPAWSTLILRNLLENDSIKNRYINKTCYFISTIFDSINVLEKVNFFEEKLNHEIDYQHKRWGSNRSRWEKEIKRVKDFATHRAKYIYQFLEEKFNLTTRHNIKINPKKNCKILFNGFEINESYEGQFYKGTNQLLICKPDKWYDFVSWKGLDENNSQARFNIENNVLVEPVLKKKPKSSLFGFVKFSEITMKKQYGMSDWLELYNNTDKPIDISNWYLLRDGKKEFQLPKPTVIKPYGYLVITKKSEVLDSLFNIRSIPGMFALKDTSMLELFTKKGNLVDSIKLNFNGSKHIELMNIWSKRYTNIDWKVIDELTPGEVNVSVREQINFNKLMNYFVIPGVLLIVLILIIIMFVRRKRLRSSTE